MLHTRIGATTAALAVAMTAAPAAAQVCDGRLSFNYTGVQAGLELAAGRELSAIGVTVGYGTDALFGAASLSPARLAVTLGTDQPLTLDNRFHACPLVTVAWTRRPAGARGAAAAGASLGVLLKNAASLSVAPAVTFLVHAEPEAAPAVTASLAVGITLRTRLLVRPSVGHAFGRRRGSSAQLTMGFGWKG